MYASEPNQLTPLMENCLPLAKSRPSCPLNSRSAVLEGEERPDEAAPIAVTGAEGGPTDGGHA